MTIRRERGVEEENEEDEEEERKERRRHERESVQATSPVACFLRLPLLLNSH